jgi:hypothetical protein
MLTIKIYVIGILALSIISIYITMFFFSQLPFSDPLANPIVVGLIISIIILVTILAIHKKLKKKPSVYS